MNCMCNEISKKVISICAKIFFQGHLEQPSWIEREHDLPMDLNQAENEIIET